MDAPQRIANLHQLKIPMKKQIEKETEDKYSKRIDYLVGANNELMKELEQCESEIVTVSKGFDT